MTTRPPKLRAVAGAAALTLLLAACGRGEAEVEVRPPMQVPVELVPETLGEHMSIIENTDESTVEAFAATDPNVLIADGRLWEIRSGQRLVGALQISTMQGHVDLSDERVRRDMVNDAMPGTVRRAEVQGITVHETSTQDKITFMWFGRAFYNVLQLKATQTRPEEILNAIIAHQISTPVGQRMLLREGMEDEADDEDEEA